ncbi:gamma-glutamyl-gamma-aminobutyrate hydrolase family protein [Gluconacetobacter entanii]|jgi:putative glutamine amidotransferase|uniref:Gamma-glutamyl-gamma-aminobutyrate hydrolase family protein n=1 Tax=Gluconacetobacter entanii TaxID=108528 RepID=A0ABT3K590_9PROT|nr:gamma-glutamyl-gamma-aminobutyrate hydrolase family protein [Gluconacetobacter entanii]MBE7620629.1 gamma-glutamyl-gamma-aminobutyrate hydrolase family protein [Komagataeibacter sp. FXV2]MCW4590583.1 gamma-glutamyl-gamma-aminobutyrate hydrolase family protein [Gluconacetobacter entanii]MCW4592874.1 gamma-glutamyl-gamma-aminobutyrate hydrolase family protein [Gluconacetobacter entanii]NPC90253.1 gamma-glutamyl-gamma-aminobutyrate hydrolase family protein [Gluconacetobacter entanii]
MDTSPPLIGVTLDCEPPCPPQRGGYSRYPWYALRCNYMEAVTAAGGLPVGLPHDAAQAAAMVARLDGLIVTGGAFDIAPDLYDGGDAHPTVTTKSTRTTAELALVEAALRMGRPILGICGGEQLLAVALGGTLIQHIPDTITAPLPHEQPNPRHEAGHEVTIVPGTRLAHITRATRMAVNSSHHQAIATPGRAIVSAVAPDGVIEAVELPGHPFCIGVQWHPEFGISAGDRLLFDALIDASRHTE